MRLASGPGGGDGGWETDLQCNTSDRHYYIIIILHPGTTLALYLRHCCASTLSPAEALASAARCT